MSKPGRVFLMNSDSGQIFKSQVPLLADALVLPAEFAKTEEVTDSDNPGTRSRRLREQFGVTLAGVQCAARPFDFPTFAFATTVSTHHMRAIKAKSQDTVGGEWSIQGKGSAALKQKITDFFTNAFGDMTLGDGLGNIWTDYEALGNGYMEIIPNALGEPAGLAHVPAPEIFIRLDGLGYVQQKAGKYQHFRRYGVDPAVYAALDGKDPLQHPDCTAIDHFVAYSPWSLFYGIPNIMPAWNALALSVLVAEYNLQFFAHNAIPDFAVILEGNWEDDAEGAIRENFRTHLKGKAHKTMVISTPEGGKITFQKLSGDAKDGSFRLLKQDCRDEVLQAHGVPPQKVGIVERSSRLGNAGDEQIVEYKNSIVKPGRFRVTTKLNKIINVGFGTNALEFVFEPYDTEDMLANSKADSAYLDRGVVTPNETRQVRFSDLPPLPGGDTRLVDLQKPAAPEAGLDALKSIQREVRSELTKKRGLFS